ncbi:MAG: LysR family transcriptional regulator, partial [Mesorhizobium sp.]
FEPRVLQTVTIRVPISFALLVLVPALPDLAKALPWIRLDLVTIHRPTDYDEAGSTLDIRFGNGSFSGRDADRLTVEWFAASGLAGHSQRSHRFDSFVAAMEAAKSGAGALLGSRPLIEAALKDNLLVRLSDFELSSPSGHFLTWPSSSRLSGAEQDFRRWLLSRLASISA